LHKEEKNAGGEAGEATGFAGRLGWIETWPGRLLLLWGFGDAILLLFFWVEPLLGVGLAYEGEVLFTPPFLFAMSLWILLGLLLAWKVHSAPAAQPDRLIPPTTPVPPTAKPAGDARLPLFQGCLVLGLGITAALILNPLATGALPP